MLAGAMDKSRAQAVLSRGLEIVLVSGHQHDLLGFEIEEVRNQQIDLAVRLVVANVLGRKNAVPGETGMLGHVREQRDVTVGERGYHESCFQTLQSGNGVRPRL